jgi:uncharacterized protein (UPF0332 family)
MPCRSGYISLAQELYGNTPPVAAPDEAKWRSAISRAYYGVFNMARQVLETRRKKPFERGGVHGAVLRALRDSGDATLISIGRDLQNLKDWRERADYGDDIPKCRQNTEAQLLRALKIRQDIESLTSP